MITAAHRIEWLAAALLITLSCWQPATALADDQGNRPAFERPRAEEVQARTQDMETDPDMYLQLIGRMQDKNLFFASLAHLDAFDHRWPGNQKAILLRADALRETGYLDKAATLYEGLRNGPVSASAHHGIGLIASKKGDMNAALLALVKANDLSPTDAGILNDLGYIQLTLHQMPEAGFNLHKATELDPKNGRAGANLALFYLLDNKPAHAQGIMDWYKLTDRQRKEIAVKAAGLAKPVPSLE